METSAAASAFGLPRGFLVLLHLESIQEAASREFESQLIVRNSRPSWISNEAEPTAPRSRFTILSTCPERFEDPPRFLGAVDLFPILTPDEYRSRAKLCQDPPRAQKELTYGGSRAR